MEYTDRLAVRTTSFTDRGQITIRLEEELVGADGRVRPQNIFHDVQAPEADAIELGKRNGRTDGEWGNREIEQLIRADRVVDQPAMPAMPPRPPIVDRDGVTELRPAAPATEATEPTFKPRFADGIAIQFRRDETA
jgi:hypothetical protein